ncbi:hypothetical protein [Lederbergia citri]|uniref:Uncharacterized protein n=1 Tax=Lederbergia citri TaxID=2833580 RepID=A0A942YJS5_9BACI|nr:hypothetical protein [Lederbergia citri]MBS4196656.1 hypothetical protein [Lederbergia citri]
MMISRIYGESRSEQTSNNEDLILPFFAPEYIGIVEWWFTNGIPYPPHMIEEQVVW